MIKSTSRIGRSAGLALTIAALLGACGGGGGDGAAAPFQQAPRVDITRDNATAVAAEGIDAAGAGGTGGGLLTGVELSVAPAESASAFAAMSDALRLALRTRPASALVGVTSTTTVACTNGGSITMTINVANPNAPSAGDRVDMSFNACVEGAVTTNGGLSFAYAQIDPSLTLIVADVSASQFSVTVAGIGPLLNGATRFSIDLRDPTLEVVGVSSAQFSFDRVRNGSVRATRTLLNFNYASTTSVATGSKSETFSYILSGNFPRIGAVSMEVATIQPVVTAAGALHPSSGAGKITGRDNKSIAVTVQATGLLLDIDTDGDGDIDVQIFGTWPDIDDEL